MTIAIRANGNAQPSPQDEEHHEMNEHQIVDSSFTAIINAPIDKIDIPEWCFGLSESIRAVPRHISPLDSQPRQTASECRSTSRSSAAA